MRPRALMTTAVVVIAAALVICAGYAQSQMADKDMLVKKETVGDKSGMMSDAMKMPFGGEADVAFAEALWKAIDGYEDWALRSDIHEGTSPHGKFLRIYYDIVNVDGKPYHVLVKDNYGGDGVTLSMVQKMPSEYLLAVTVMVQREPGYDPEDNNWFYAKYAPDGTIVMADNGMAMAGRVAKGMEAGCIPCHVKAGGGDFVFWND